MAFFQSQSWHEGEDRIHQLTGVPENDNPTSPFLTPRAAMQIQRYSLIALGTLDKEDRPWTTLWGGEPPLAQAIAQSVIGIKTRVDASFDPVVEAVFEGKDDGEVIRESGAGRMISGLSIELEERSRVKFYGRMIAGALDAGDKEGDGGKPGDMQLVVKIEQSLANCPKYLNKKHISSTMPSAKLVSTSTNLTSDAIELISKADLFFVSSAHEHEDMDTNHRGGPPGFIRVHYDENDDTTSIVWPEYSGNNLYQTLGNLMTTPKAGIVIPDFDTGDVIYLTGETEVLIGAEAVKVVAKSTLAVKMKIIGARYVKNGLPFRGKMIDDGVQGRSPYNPRIRYLTSEKVDALAKDSSNDSMVTAQLIKKTRITPTIYRYRFSLSDPKVYGPWKPGQYVAFDFSRELNMGYSHMRDDDPTSLNDDYIRTFTVSSVPGSLGLHGEEFEVTVRNVGSVTGWLSHQREGHIEADIRGFGGEFRFDQSNGHRTGFIAAGIGITPLLGQMGELDLSRVKIWWSVGIKDVGLVADVLEQYPKLKGCIEIYLSGEENILKTEKDREMFKKVLDLDLHLKKRRLLKEDFDGFETEVDDWYLCTAPTMRKQIQEWMPKKSIVFENFDY